MESFFLGSLCGRWYWYFRAFLLANLDMCKLSSFCTKSCHIWSRNLNFFGCLANLPNKNAPNDRIIPQSLEVECRKVWWRNTAKFGSENAQNLEIICFFLAYINYFHNLCSRKSYQKGVGVVKKSYQKGVNFAKKSL